MIQPPLIMSWLNDGIAKGIASFFSNLFQSLMDYLHLYTFKYLIYGTNTASQSKLAYNIFYSDDITKVVIPGMDITYALASVIVIIGIVLWGARMANVAYNPAARTEALQTGFILLFVMLMLNSTGAFYSVILETNQGIVNFFHAGLKDSLKAIEPVKDSTGIGEIFVLLFLLGLMVWGNFYYLMRKYVLIILMIIGPICIALYIIPQTRHIFGAWLKEMIGTVFVQSIHALLFMVVSILAKGNTSPMMMIVAYMVFIPTGEAIKGIFGLSSGMLGSMHSAGANMGMGAISTGIGAMKAFKDDLLEKRASASSDGKSKSDSDTKTADGTNTGTTTAADDKAARMFKAGDLWSAAGKAIGGTALGLAGSPMGKDGQIAGAFLGSKVGSALGGLTGRAGAAGLNRLADSFGAAKDGFNEKMDELNQGDLTDEQLADKIADSETSKWANTINGDTGLTNEQLSKKAIAEAFPNATDSAKDRMYKKELAQKKAGFMDMAKDRVADLRNNEGKFATQDELVNQATSSLANAYTDQHKDGFINDYMKGNPTHDMATANKAWDSHLVGKTNDFKNSASSVAKNLANGTSGYVDKEAFAKSLTNQLTNNDVNSFMKANPLASEQEINDKRLGAQQMYQSASQLASKNATSASMLSPSRHINSGYMAQQLATQAVEGQEKAFIQKFGDNAETRAKWAEEKPKAYEQNLQHYANTISGHIPKAPQIQSGFAKGAMGITAGAVSFMSHATGVQGLSNNLATQYVQGSLTGGLQAIREGQGFVQTLKNMASSGSGQYQLATNTNAVEKEANFRNAWATVGGIAMGVSGYQAMARTSNKLNPYSKPASSMVSEVSEVAQMAQRTIDDKGMEHIADGAIRMVTTNNKSFIEVRDRTGQTQVVSNYGSGDGNLRKGQVVYQDLDYRNGSLQIKTMPGTNQSAYMQDSGGSKQMYERTINVNPNKLFANQSMNQKNQPVRYNVPSFNEKVDVGTYHIQDMMNDKVQDIKYKVERDRSYIVGTVGNQEVRLSPYGNGDARLSQDEQIVSRCSIANHKLAINYVNRLSNGEEIEDFIYSSTDSPNDLKRTVYDPNNLVTVKPNARLVQRNQFDKQRFKQGMTGADSITG